MAIGLTDADEGKRVIDANGNEVGIISTVEGETALVDPDPSLTDDIKSALGFGDTDEDQFPLQTENVAEVTDDEIRLDTTY